MNRVKITIKRSKFDAVILEGEPQGENSKGVYYNGEWFPFNSPNGVITVTWLEREVKPFKVHIQNLIRKSGFPFKTKLSPHVANPCKKVKLRKTINISSALAGILKGLV